VSRTRSETVWMRRFWANRRGQCITTEIKKFGNDGMHVIDVRLWSTGADGRLIPSASGVCLHINKLPELRDAINKLAAAAAELGLLDAG
jgi:hypothetical protein